MTSASTTPQTDREALIAAVQSAERCASAAVAGKHVDMTLLGAEMRAALWAAGAEAAPAPASSPMGEEFGEIEQIMRAAGLEAADRLRDVADGARRVFEHMATALEAFPARRAEALAKFRAAILAIPCEMGMRGNNFRAGHSAAIEAAAAVVAGSAAPSHEGIVQEGATLVCTACGTTSPAMIEPGETMPGVFTNVDDLFNAMGISDRAPPLDAQTIRSAALEEAAKVCDAAVMVYVRRGSSGVGAQVCEYLARTIRALLSPEKQDSAVAPAMTTSPPAAGSESNQKVISAGDRFDQQLTTTPPPGSAGLEDQPC